MLGFQFKATPLGVRAAVSAVGGARNMLNGFEATPPAPVAEAMSV